jgi:hypothetical protein
MQHRELRESAGPQHPRHLTQRALRPGDVHQAHERGHRVEGRCAEGQRGAVADQVANPSAVMPGGRGNERLGDIQGGHPGTLTGQQAGVVPLTAAQVEARQPVNRREQPEKCRGIHQVPIAIKPSA